MAPTQNREGVCPDCGGPRARGQACPRCLMQLGLPDSPPGVSGATLGPDAGARPQELHDLGIENFRIFEKLGEGGMGEVFAAEQLVPVRRQVALKVIKWGMDTREVVARFETERQALALMSHSAIARVFEAGATATGRPFFAMELVQGEPITDYCDAHRLTTRERIELFLQVCRGVHHAHRKGIIHRDLKPSNILVSGAEGAPIVKVIDFGIAKATEQHLTEHTVFTQQGILIGTPEYMSPEQARLSAFDIDTRSDLYSLGVLLYELLTGELPLDRDSLRRGSTLDIQRRILEDDPPRPSTRFEDRSDRATQFAERRRSDVRSLRRGLSGDLDWIIMKSLEKDPGRRYESAAHLRRDLERYLGDEPVSAGPPSLSYRVGKFARRHRIAVAAASLVLVALVLGLVLAVAGLVRARRAETIASAERDKAEAINHFLVEMLGSANPYAEAGRDVTVVETLEASVERVEESFADQPEIRNELQLTIGSSYTLLGVFDKAEPLLRATLDDRLSRYEANDSRVAAAEHALGVLLTQGSRFEDGAELLRRALATRREVLGPTSDEATTSATNLSMALSRLAEFDEAAALLEETIEHRRAVGAAPEKIGVVYNNLGIILRRAGRLQEAERAHLQGLELRKAGLGPDHPHVAESLGNLAAVYRQQERLDEAEEHYGRSLELLTHHLGPDHSRVGTLYNNLGGIYYRRGDHARAKELYAEAHRITSAHFDRDHPSMASLLNNIANVENELGNFDLAATKHREVLAIRRRIFGDEHPSVAISLSGLASALCEGGWPQEAIAHYEESVSIYRRTLGPDSWRTARVASAFGECLRLGGEHGRAEAELLYAAEILECELGDAHRETRVSWKRLAALYDSWGRPTRARELRERLDGTPQAGAERDEPPTRSTSP